MIRLNVLPQRLFYSLVQSRTWSDANQRTGAAQGFLGYSQGHNAVDCVVAIALRCVIAHIDQHRNAPIQIATQTAKACNCEVCGRCGV